MPKKILVGCVVSDKSDKTVVVQVDHTYRHPVYQKILKKSKKYSAHDEANEFKIGDFVKVQESRPISKNKKWVVLQKLKNIHSL